MQEKDIRKKLNQELDKMAPDILDKILATPIEPVKNEKELFGKNKHLFKEPVNWKKYIWAPAITAAVACILIVVMIMQPSIINTPENNPTGIAFSVTIDVNPSISISVKKDGTVESIQAGNKDAAKIVRHVNKKIDKDTDYNKAVKLVIKQLDKNGYLKEKKNGMLVSVISKDKSDSKNKLTEIKEQTKKVEKQKNIKSTTIYQACSVTDQTVKVAEKNNVSLGKAALCIKLAEKEKVSVKQMCKKSIDDLIKKTEETGIVVEDDEIVIEGDLFFETESPICETESACETESVSETIGMEEESTESESSTTEETSIQLETESVTGAAPVF